LPVEKINSLLPKARSANRKTRVTKAPGTFNRVVAKAGKVPTTVNLN
jgi:hypothetical protein